MYNVWYCPTFPVEDLNYRGRVVGEVMDRLREDIIAHGMKNPIVAWHYPFMDEWKVWSEIGIRRTQILQEIGVVHAPVIIQTRDLEAEFDGELLPREVSAIVELFEDGCLETVDFAEDQLVIKVKSSVFS